MTSLPRKGAKLERKYNRDVKSGILIKVVYKEYDAAVMIRRR